MKRPGLLMTSLMVAMLCDGVRIRPVQEYKPNVVVPPQTPEAADEKIKAAQAKRDRKKLNRRLQAQETP